VQEILYFIQVYCTDKIPSEMVMNQDDTGIKGNKKKKNSW